MDIRKTVLFICGSLNQTTMMHKISEHLTGFDCYFTPFYADGLVRALGRRGLLDFTILGGKHRQNTDAYLADHHLNLDFGGRQREYDLVVSGTDLIVQKNIRDKRFVLVQEGILEAETWVYPLVKHFGWPRYLANTAATGLSDAYDVLCAASPGYRDEFIRKGVKPEKIIVTGIPNFDDAKSFYGNDFQYRNYVLAATSPLRETFRLDDRRAFIRKVEQIAAGRPIIFKLHPLENEARARREILSLIPRALVRSDGNTEHMVANCEVLITQISSVTFTGLALEKEVHTDLDLATIKQLAPIQNGGRSARKIATLCQDISQVPLKELKSPHKRYRLRRDWLGSDAM